MLAILGCYVMQLTTTTVANIKASEGVYRASDVGRHYGVHRSTVCRIWQGQIHRDVSPAPDFPDIHTRLRGEDLTEEIRTLLARGMKPSEIAEHLGIAERTVWYHRGVFV